MTWFTDQCDKRVNGKSSKRRGKTLPTAIPLFGFQKWGEPPPPPPATHACRSCQPECPRPAKLLPAWLPAASLSRTSAGSRAAWPGALLLAEPASSVQVIPSATLQARSSCLDAQQSKIVLRRARHFVENPTLLGLASPLLLYVITIININNCHLSRRIERIGDRCHAHRPTLVYSMPPLLQTRTPKWVAAHTPAQLLD